MEAAMSTTLAERIAKVTPVYPFHGIERFYDISGFMLDPVLFKEIIDVFVERYRSQGVDAIAGVEARGFVLGPQIALALGIPFFMLRKEGKLPNCVSVDGYKVEYGTRTGLCMPTIAVKAGARVVIVDDLIATGGTLCASMELITKAGMTVHECACVVRLTHLEELRLKTFTEQGFGTVSCFGVATNEIIDAAAN